MYVLKYKGVYLNFFDKDLSVSIRETDKIEYAMRFKSEEDVLKMREAANKIWASRGIDTKYVVVPFNKEQVIENLWDRFNKWLHVSDHGVRMSIVDDVPSNRDDVTYKWDFATSADKILESVEKLV